MKKVSFMVMVVLLLGVFGLAACTESLAEYKAAKLTELLAYADAKDMSNYSIEGWEAVCKGVKDGKEEISSAETKPAVDTAFTEAKNVIDKVEDLGLEKKIIWNGTIADIVDNETILITIDKYFNSKEFTADDFKMVEIVENEFSWLTKTAYDNYMETDTLPDDFRHIIIFKIVDKGAQNLINSIRKLEAVNFVNSALPNRFDIPTDPQS